MKIRFRPIAVGLLALSAGMCGGWNAFAAGAEPSAQPVGGLEGVLKDPNGRVAGSLNLPVSVKNVANGKIYSGRVEAGHYAVRNLPAGNYELDLPIPGVTYHSYEQKGIVIRTGQTLKMDLPIQWGVDIGELGNDPAIFSNDLRSHSHYVDGPTPRSPDGHPDLSGEWAPIPVTGGERGPSLQPWAKAIDLKLQAAGRPGKDGGPGIGGPAADCVPHGATPARTSHGWEFIQTPTRLIQLIAEETPMAREIYLDGRKQPSPDLWNPSYYGHSVGHWEGDALVIDTVGFNDITPGYGVHTEALHVIERITRPSVGRLMIDITATDPKAWTAPFHSHAEEGLVTGDEIQEWVCFRNDAHFGGDWLTLIQQLMATAPSEGSSESH